MCKKLLSYFQGNLSDWSIDDQTKLRDIIPEDRRWAYPVRDVIEILSDRDSFLELRKVYGRSVITGFIRIEGTWPYSQRLPATWRSSRFRGS